ncbi:MAG: DNA-binding protein [Pseudomonadota bacterium]
MSYTLKTPAQSPWLRSQQAAQYLGLSKSYLDKKRDGDHPGGGPKFLRRGKIVFYHIDWLNDWLVGRPPRSVDDLRDSPKRERDDV